MLHFCWSLRAMTVAVVAFAGTIPALPAAAEVPNILAAAAPTERADFELYFPARDSVELTALIEAQNQPGSPEYHKWLTPQQFEQRFGPTPATISAVTAELAARGLTVTEHRGQMLHVEGTAGAVEAAFGIRLSHAQLTGGFQALVANQPLAMPPAIAASGARTPQFTTVPPFQKHSRTLGVVPNNFISSTGPYFTPDLRQAYDFPSAQAVVARGVRIGILMSGDFDESDLEQYWSDILLPPSLWPNVVSIPINGGLAFSPDNSGETHLDIQQAGGISMGATIGLYNLSDLSEPTIIFGLNKIVDDNIVDVVNMSFGGAEVNFLAANNRGIPQTYLLEIQNLLFQQGTAQGITFVASSGDHGAIPVAGVAQKPTLSVEYPASDPFVVAVGGTNLVTTHSASSNTSAYVSENARYDLEQKGEVWGSGGGISIFFGKPPYQTLVPTQSSKFRTVPDLAGHMGGLGAFGCTPPAVRCNVPDSADIEVIGGQETPVIGTSASAPDFVGLLALKIALTRHRLGWENVDIYTRARNQIRGIGAPFRHKNIPGNNGHYATTTPYDLVLGNGTVDARQFLGATNLPAAGIPGTASNP